MDEASSISAEYSAYITIGLGVLYAVVRMLLVHMRFELERNPKAMEGGPKAVWFDKFAIRHSI